MHAALQVLSALYAARSQAAQPPHSQAAQVVRPSQADDVAGSERPEQWAEDVDGWKRLEQWDDDADGWE